MASEPLALKVNIESTRPLENGCFTSYPFITMIALLAIGLLVTGGMGLHFQFVNVVTSGSLMGVGAILLFTAIIIATCRSRQEVIPPSQSSSSSSSMSQQPSSFPPQPMQQYRQRYFQSQQQPPYFPQPLQQQPQPLQPLLNTQPTPSPIQQTPSAIFAQGISPEERRKELSRLLFGKEESILKSDQTLFRLAKETFPNMVDGQYQRCAQAVIEACCKAHEDNPNSIHDTPEYVILEALYEDKRATEISFDPWFRELMEQPIFLRGLLAFTGKKGWHQFIDFFAKDVKSKSLPLNEIVAKHGLVLIQVCRAGQFADQAADVRTLLPIFNVHDPSDDDAIVRAHWLGYFFTTFCDQDLTVMHLNILEAVFLGYAHHVDKDWMPFVLSSASQAFYQYCPKKQVVFDVLKGQHSLFGKFVNALVRMMSGGINQNWRPDTQQRALLELILHQEVFVQREDLKKAFDIIAIIEPSTLEHLLLKILLANWDYFLKYLLDRYKDPENPGIPTWSHVWPVTLKCLLKPKISGVLENLNNNEFSLFFRCVVIEGVKGEKKQNWEPTGEQERILIYIFKSLKFNLLDVNQQRAFDTLTSINSKLLNSLLSLIQEPIFENLQRVVFTKSSEAGDQQSFYRKALRIICEFYLEKEDRFLSMKEGNYVLFINSVLKEFSRGQPSTWQPNTFDKSVLELIAKHQGFIKVKSGTTCIDPSWLPFFNASTTS